MVTIWGLGLSLSWGWKGEDTGTGSMVQRGKGCFTQASNAHYFGHKSSVSWHMYMYVCCEDSSYRRQALRKVQLHNQHSTGPAQRRTRQYWAVTGTRPGCDFFFRTTDASGCQFIRILRLEWRPIRRHCTYVCTCTCTVHVHVHVHIHPHCTLARTVFM